MSNTDPSEVSTADQYRFPDGTIEVVFEVADGSVLTVREYSSRMAFQRSVADATYLGIHDGVADLPDVEWFDDTSDEG